MGEYLSRSKGRYGFMSESVLNIAQNIRDGLGLPLRINSAYRSPEYNRRIGGARLSRHMYGDGLDISGASLNKMQEQCRRQGASFIQLYADGHAHCDWRNLPSDLTFFGSSGISDLSVAQFSDEDFVRLQEVLGGTPRIEMANGELRFGGTVTFAVRLPAQEDPGPLLTEWALQAPNGEVLESTVEELQVELTLPGTYKISVRVGGYVSHDQQFEIK